MFGHDAVTTSRSRSINYRWNAARFIRHAAAEFSFFLAVPTMMAVTCYSVLTHESSQMKGYELILKSEQIVLPIGNVAFIVAVLAIKFLLKS
jgi:undecaprenyl-diphosphatase